jgi:acyl-CoA synthetase (AMP-forming)/AMP-acid ligase II
VPPRNLIELLEAAAAAGTGGLRFVDRREQAELLSWAEIASRARRAAGWLVEQGVVQGDRLALVLRTSPAFFDAFLGALWCGAVPVPLYPPVRLGRLDEYHRATAAMLDAVDARLTVSDPVVARLLGETVARSRGTRLAVLDADAIAGAEAPAAPSPAADDLAMVQFSSGTTVAPKPVALSHRALLAQVEALNRHWRHLPDVSGVSWLPLYHDMGLIGCVFPAQELATELTLIPPELFVARPAIWLRTLSRYRGSVSPAPNFAYGLCVEKVSEEDLAGVDLSHWRAALNGAEAVSAEVMRRFSRRFAPWGFRAEALTPVYGLSEASLAVTFSAIEEPFVSYHVDAAALADQGRARLLENGLELVSVGRPLPGFALEIRDAKGRPLAEGSVRRLWARGPSLMSGYLGLPEATREVLVDGWLDTGDDGFLLDGELFLTGRAKDILVLRGRNHAPEDVERAVDDVPGVRTGCAAAVTHREAGGATDVLLLFVELRPSAGSPAEVAAACRRRVLGATGLSVDRVVPLAPGSLPRTSSGKIRRREALARHLRGELAPPPRMTWWRMLKALLRSRRALAKAGRG